MTDTEQKRIKEICKVSHIDDISDLSDGYHTFKQLYYQRMMLFAIIVKQNKDKAWKSLRHEDGELCFGGGGWFVVGIDTPKGSYTYHYEDNYFSLFDCVELERGKSWDGHTEKDVTRLLSLGEPCIDAISREATLKIYKGLNDEDTISVWLIRKNIEQQPPVTPQLKTGHWIVNEWGNMSCSECGCSALYDKVYPGESVFGKALRVKTTFCPTCGAKMIDAQERSE